MNKKQKKVIKKQIMNIHIIKSTNLPLEQAKASLKQILIGVLQDKSIISVKGTLEDN